MRYLVSATVLAITSLTASALRAEPAENPRGMVATVHPLATRAGVAAMEEGGNAVDAAVAAALTLGVVDGHNSGIGGGCFILIRTAEGKLVAIDGRETAPARSTRDMYLKDGEPQPELSKTGALASGTPGALAAYDLAVKKFGGRRLKDMLLPAAKIAQEGFPLDRVYAEAIASKADDIGRFPAARAILLKENGEPYTAGDVLRQPDLANTYRSIAEGGVEWFYSGPFAEKTADWMAEHGGILAEQDFAEYRAKLRQPVVTEYRDYTIVGYPPPSSGGVHVAQILNMLEQFDVAELREEAPVSFIHVAAEAMKLAFADRAYWLGDPDFAKVPSGLIDESYAQTLARRINQQRVTAVEQQGEPPRAERDFFGKHTTHIAAADAEGNWVAITATINTTFGSKVIIPGTGVVMNNEMDDFSIAPGVPNAFGLVGAEANEIEPGKRPLSSMSPTIVLQDGEPVMTVGAAGGPMIITSTLLAIVRHLDFDLPLLAAVGAPRFHQQWRPDVLFVESVMPDDLVAALKARGHKVQRRKYMGVAQAIARPGGEGAFIGVHDPRAPGLAAGPAK